MVQARIQFLCHARGRTMSLERKADGVEFKHPACAIPGRGRPRMSHGFQFLIPARSKIHLPSIQVSRVGVTKALREYPRRVVVTRATY
jgi:hypothetical protein